MVGETERAGLIKDVGPFLQIATAGVMETACELSATPCCVYQQLVRQAGRCKAAKDKEPSVELVHDHSVVT